MSERIISIAEIKDTLPCKESLIMLDRVQQINENKIIGLKGVTLDELHFIGHFPGHPIMPGVLQCEAIAQLGELAVWQRLDPERKYDIYIKKMSNVKFRKPNNPGDRIMIDVDITEVTTDSASLKAVVSNNSGAACQAEMILGVRERETDIHMPAGFNQYDKSEKSEMDVNKIMSYIPHRYPFLFVDYVSSITEQGHVVAVKNTTSSEAIFRKYNDGYMVMTGSVHPEITAQAGCIYMLSNPASKGKIAYFMGLDECDFYGAVHPGDQMVLEVDIPDNTKKFGKGEGSVYVDGKKISTTRMKFAIVDP